MKPGHVQMKVKEEHKGFLISNQVNKYSISFDHSANLVWLIYDHVSQFNDRHGSGGIMKGATPFSCGSDRPRWPFELTGCTAKQVALPKDCE